MPPFGYVAPVLKKEDTDDCNTWTGKGYDEYERNGSELVGFSCLNEHCCSLWQQIGGLYIASSLQKGLFVHSKEENQERS